MPRPPHISIPRGAAPPAVPSSVVNGYTPVDIAESATIRIFQEQDGRFVPSPSNAAGPSLLFPSPSTGRYRSISASRPASVHETESARIPFPEPELSLSPDKHLLRTSSHVNLTHRSAKSDTLDVRRPSIGRGESRPPSFVADSSPESIVADLPDDDLHNVTLQSAEGLRRFQAGELDPADEEWYRLVPQEVPKAWPKQDVLRQCAIFEIIKSEKEYVEDMKVAREVFKDALVNVAPIHQTRLKGFVEEVFYNMDDILAHHQRLLDNLYARQTEQHPIVVTIADIILDAILSFRSDYEKYIKHYPIAEAYHRKELHRNPRYQAFLAQCVQNPRARKKDLISFLSRPVTRLPRLMLQLDSILKHTVPDHIDQETIPVIRETLNAYIRSSQVGVEAADSKVKFWDLCESLSYQKGEIIDLDLYDDNRTLVHAGPLARRYRGDVGYDWADLHVALLDNYLLLLQPRTRPGGTARYIVISRPIPLEYLRLASFVMPVEYRKEKTRSNTEQSARGLFEFRSSAKYRELYPFTIYHAYAKSARRYTLYASTEDERATWRTVLIDALAVRKTKNEANMWFAPHTINDGFFKWGGTSLTRPTGKITCAAPFSHGGKDFVAVGCQTGVHEHSRIRIHMFTQSSAEC
ncbi:hypothetical protein NM688_g8645 [Phlebia brevispora]|uniref:Uncharacterized protein n=1 Tax=Phlebia brevispora TaxID=194682 RepID=A0ACC1RRD1_9APHY|nr:hypothetical protein NM688_g8645 [Phlebia brevispora]